MDNELIRLIIPQGMCLAGGFLIPLGLCYMRIRKQIEGWQSVRATATDVQTERRYHGGRSSTLYTVSYTYEAAGRVFSKVLQGYTGHRYSKGDTLDLWVDPQNPDGHLVMAEAGGLDQGLLFLILGILLLAGGVLLTLTSPLPTMVVAVVFWLVIGISGTLARVHRIRKRMQDG